MNKSFIFLLVVIFNLLNAQNGIIDSSFGNNGLVTFNIGQTYCVMKSIAVQPDGKIVMAGYASESSKNFICLVRLNSDGTSDNSFGNNGIVSTIMTYSCIASDLVLQNDGKIIVAGHAGMGGDYSGFALIKYNSNGSLDSTFGNSGIVLTAFDNIGGIGKSLSLQNDGKIILGGHTYTSNSDIQKFALVRYNQNGTLDNSFGTNGKVFTSFTKVNLTFQQDIINSVVIQSDGKILAGGLSNNTIAIARYKTNGSLDTSFGNNGLVKTFISNTTQSLSNSIVISNDGSIFSCGFSIDINGFQNSTIAKYNSSGNLSVNFGSGGILINNLSSGNDYYKEIKIMNNKILVGGITSDSNNNSKFSLVQYDINGILNNSFGNNGVFTYSSGSTQNVTEAIEIQKDGKIITTGYINNNTYSSGTIRVISNNLIQSNDISNVVIVFPNPFTDNINVQFLQLIENLQIKLYDTAGRLVFNLNKKDINQSESLIIDASDFEIGNYILSIEGKDFFQTFKMIKK